MPFRRVMLWCTAALYVTALIVGTFMPSPESTRSQWYWPVIAFLPVGVLFLLLLGRRRWWAAIAFGILGAVWVEAAQSAWMPAGYASIMDVMWAALGLTAGVALAGGLTAPKRPRERASNPSASISLDG